MDITTKLGNKYGLLTVVAYLKINNNAVKWECKCDCGNVVYVSTSHLGKTTNSCGCYKIAKLKKNEIGNKYNLLLVTEEAGQSSGGTFLWKCLCDCGKETIVRGDSLRDGSVKSCGHLQLQSAAKTSQVPYGEATKNKIISHIIAGAIKREYIVSLSREELYNLTQNDCFYCGIPPSTLTKSKHNKGDFIWNGIDRVDNKIGYIKTNCVTCCEPCNRAKLTRDLATYLKWIEKSYLHLRSKGLI
jgi:hypothetical protein